MKPHKATVDSDFLRHPSTGAFFRNPLKQSKASGPVVLSAGEYDFNCLDEALADWSCITIRESSLKELVGSGDSTMPLSASWAAMGKIKELQHGYDFIVTMRKSSYVAPRVRQGRHQATAPPGSTLVDKVNIAVSEAASGSQLRVDWIASAGLVSEWNMLHPTMAVKTGDCILRVNEKKSQAAMLEELQSAANDQLRLLVHRDTGFLRKMSNEQPTVNMEGAFPAAALAKPVQELKR